VIDPEAAGFAEPLAPRGEDWIQVDCALFRTLEGGEGYFPWEDLRASLAEWRHESRFRYFSFLRKPPGLRLRFGGPDVRRGLAPLLVEWLDRAQARDAIRSFAGSVYEPETSRFGGPAGIDIAHDYFDRDSRLQIEHEVRRAREDDGAPRDELSLAATNDLLRRVVDDSAEVWDVWARLADAVRTVADLTATPIARHGEAAICAPAWAASLTSSDFELLERAFADNEEIARRLRAAIALGELSCGRREWLASACIFHWNRANLDLEDLRVLLASMIELLRPPEQRAGGGDPSGTVEIAARTTRAES
jgi:thiopeptide-type bacteriocin biosynthesis protein